MKCKICLSGTNSIYDQKSDLLYHYCSHCEFVALDEKNILLPEIEKKRYEMHENHIKNVGYVAMFEKFISCAITPFQNNIKTILDYGCGPGPVLAELLKRHGYSVDIYDPYFAPIKIFTNKKYDMITTTEVIEHIRDPLPFIKKLKNLITPSGHIAIMTQFNSNTPETFLSWYYRREDTHISFFTRKTFELIAEMLQLRLEICDNIKVCVYTKT
jgi:2-polyprenyl-3-methyl-5-hydroxy-6-metoxy-1,4-benzoquinol methylase